MYRECRKQLVVFVNSVVVVRKLSRQVSDSRHHCDCVTVPWHRESRAELLLLSADRVYRKWNRKSRRGVCQPAVACVACFKPNTHRADADATQLLSWVESRRRRRCVLSLADVIHRHHVSSRSLVVYTATSLHASVHCYWITVTLLIRLFRCIHSNIVSAFYTVRTILHIPTTPAFFQVSN